MRGAPRRALLRAGAWGLLALAALGCGENGSGGSDAGARLDAGAPLDAEVSSDAGVRMDASDVDASDVDASDVDASQPGDDAGPADAGREVRVTRVYVGLASGDLVVCSLDAATGALAERSRARTGELPSFVAPSPEGRFLYVVHEGARELAALAITPGTGATTVVDRADTGGGGPTHVAVSPDGRFVAAANYGGGSVAFFAVAGDGTIGDRLDLEAPGGQAHQIVFDAASAHAYVASKQDDLVAQYAVSSTGLAPLSPPSVAMRPGAGPRHLALSPDERFAYVVHELDSTITVHARAGDGTLGPELQRVSTRAVGREGANTTAEILVHPSGRFVYASNRGDDDVVRFAIAEDGLLTHAGHEPTRGETPRSMALTPDGATLLVANLSSRDVQVFRVDETSGALTHLAGMETDADAWFVGAFAIPAE